MWTPVIALMLSMFLSGVSAAEQRELLLSNWEPARWAILPGASILPGAATGPHGETLARITLAGPGAGQGLLTQVNLPATAGEVRMYLHKTDQGPGRYEVLFCDAHGWGGAGPTQWAIQADSTLTAPALAHGWSWRVGFFKSTADSPYRFRGLRLDGGDPAKTGGHPITMEAGPVRVSYTPDEDHWLYVDTQPKTLTVHDGAPASAIVRVANLGTSARTFVLTVCVRSRNEIAGPRNMVAVGSLTLLPGALTEVPLPLAFALLGDYDLEFSSDGAAPRVQPDHVVVVNAFDRSESFRHWTAQRSWFSAPERRPVTGSDGKSTVTVGSATNGLAPVPLFPVLSRHPRDVMAPSQVSQQPSSTDAPLDVLVSQLTPAWLVRSQDADLTLFGGSTHAGLGGPTHLAFATATGTRVLAIGEKLNASDLAAMTQPWLLVWWQGAQGWSSWDAPYLVSLQHRPRSLSLGSEGIALGFDAPAGSLVVMPLYGYAKLPQQAALLADPTSCRLPKEWPTELMQPWTWATAVPAVVADHCTWWCQTLMKFPYRVDESYRIDHHAGRVAVHDAFSYIDVPNDWKTTPRTFAPLSPTLALAKANGYPLTISGTLMDCTLATMFGPYTGISGASSLDYSMDIGAYLFQAAEPSQDIPPDESTPARHAQALLLGRARGIATDDESQMWDWQDGNFVWSAQGEATRDPALAAGLLPACSAKQDVKQWMMRRQLHTILDQRRYGMDERSGLLTRRYCDGPGIGNFGSGDWGDSGKLATDMVYDLYCYAYSTGDWQTIADHWDTIVSLNCLPQTMTWCSIGRTAIAEVGDEAPPMLGLARMAYAVGDQETYAAAAYWFARELVHNAVKNGGFNAYHHQFHPWNPHWDSALETATNLWGTNAAWQGGGLVTAEKGENQWINFQTRYDDIDCIRFDRDHTTALATACIAWANTHATPAWAQSMLYFYRIVLLGLDPSAAQAAWKAVNAKDASPDNYIVRIATAWKEYPPIIQTLIPSTEPAIADTTGWAADQMGYAGYGLVDQSQAVQGSLPSPQWFAWRPPVVRPGIDWGNKWTFGSIGPTAQSVVTITDRPLSAESNRWSYQLRRSTALDLFTEPLRSLVAKAAPSDTEALRLASAWESQATIPVLVAGPFANPGGGPNTGIVHGPERDYLAGTLSVHATYPDQAAQADATDKDAFPPGGSVQWQARSFSQGMLDLEHVWPQTEQKTNIACYLTLWVRSPAAMPVMLGVGSDDGIKVWLNKMMVHELGANRAAAFDQDHVTTELKQGWNSVLIKITQGSGGWAAVFRVATPAGLPIPGLEFSSTPH